MLNPNQWMRFATVLLLLSLLLCGCGRYVPQDRPVADDPTEQGTPIFPEKDVPEVDSGNGVSAATSAPYALLLDASDFSVKASENADARFAPASLTKVMTMILLCERLSEEELDADVTISSEVYDTVRSGGYRGASSFGFDPGDAVSVRNLLYGIGVASDADCTLALVLHVASSAEEFVGWMNEKAAELGMNGTHFDNVIGYESAENYSTPRDLAVMLAYALECGIIREILSQSEPYHFQYAGYTKSGDWKTGINANLYSSLFNTNPQRASRIRSYEEGGKAFALATGIFEGGKTGSLQEDGKWIYSLASFATCGGKTYVAVVGNATTSAGVMTDTKLLFDNYVAK